MKHYIILLINLLLFSTCTKSQNNKDAEPYLVGGPCEGCEAIFEYGEEPLDPVDTLPGFDEAENKLKVTGIIYHEDGITPAENIILYVYHTNPQGVYPTRGGETGWARRHGYIRGWIKTDSDGKYTFYTQKPGSYSSNPAHIHPTILEPDGKYYYIDMYLFEDDPHLTDRNRNRKQNRGGKGIVSLKKKENLLVAERDIILGKDIPGYD